MNMKLLAFLACSMAFLLGACSSNNSTGTSSAVRGTGGGNSGGPSLNAVTLANAEAALATANTRFANAQAAVGRATAAATAAAAGTGDHASARRLIASAREAINAAVEAANAAVTAAEGESATDIGSAQRALNRANAFQTEQTSVLDNAMVSLSWFGRTLARVQLVNGEAQMPSIGGDNTVSIKRIPRTIDRSATDDTQKVNPDAITRDTFKDVMYATGKEVFSIADDAEGGDEFEVDGYIGSDDGVENADRHAQYMHTGLKLTSDGIIIRTGGSFDNPIFRNLDGGPISDFTDTRRDITKSANDGFTAPASGEDPVRGPNGWDLELTFREPHITPVAGGGASSWTGNSAFYWKSIVPADSKQTETGGEYYVSGAIPQPDGFKDLGTYEVWLSNYLGLVDKGLEPVAGSGRVRCPDGSIGTSCPYDDKYQYLKYAAYGLFVYTADWTTFLSGNNGRKGRIQTLHFGYSAFADETGKKTTDIGTAITSATFSGQTLAYAVTGQPLQQQHRDSKLLRGEATFTVSIPKTGNGTIEGDLENFEEWTGNYWRPFTTTFSIDLASTSISDKGTFSGSASASSYNRSADFPSPLPTGHSSYAQSGGIARGSGSTREYKGSFYGPRSDSADLELAGSFRLESTLPSVQWEIHGSFAAKQKPAETPDS